MQEKWVEWSQRLQSIAQIGLTFCDNTFDIERYKQIQQIAAEMISDTYKSKTRINTGLL